MTQPNPSERVDYRNLPPVPENERPEPPDRLSTTKLDRADKCRRSLYLDLIHQGGAGSHAMYRGSLFHLFTERAMWTLIEQGEENLYARAENEDPVHAKQNVASLTAAIVDEVAREAKLDVSADEADKVRLAAYHWAVGYDIKPSQVVALEQLFVMDVAGYTLSGKVDLLATSDRELWIEDYKTGLNYPKREDFEQGPHSFQTKMYAALVAFGRPVEQEPCPDCADSGENGCERCVRGFIETGGDPIAGGINRFGRREVYPRVKLGDDGLVRATDRIIETRTTLHDFMTDVERLVERIDDSFKTGNWPAIPGEYQCNRCPAKPECPIPPALRGSIGVIDSLEAAEAAMAVVTVEEMWMKQVKAAAKPYAPIVVGDYVWDVVPSESHPVDTDSMLPALEHSLRTGAPFDLDAHRKKKVSTSFRKLRRKPEGKAA